MLPILKQNITVNVLEKLDHKQHLRDAILNNSRLYSSCYNIGQKTTRPNLFKCSCKLPACLVAAVLPTVC